MLKGAGAEATLQQAGCLINSDLGGRAIDPTPASCRELIWHKYLKPNYVDHGVDAFWLDETDGEGTLGGDGEHGYDTSFGPAKAYTNVRAPANAGAAATRDTYARYPRAIPTRDTHARIRALSPLALTRAAALPVRRRSCGSITGLRCSPSLSPPPARRRLSS